MKISHIIISIIIALVLISCVNKEKTHTIEVRNGVEIIRNKNIGASPELKLDLKLIRKVSLDELELPEGVPAMESFYMTALDQDMNIYISDFRKSVVYKTDINGKYITHFHRKGQGPGESNIINDIKVINDSVYVFGEYGKTSVFTRSGSFERQLMLLDGKYGNMQIVNTDDNYFSYTRNVQSDHESKVVRTKLGVYQHDVKNMQKYSNILEIEGTTDFNNYKYLMGEDQRSFAFYSSNIFVEDLSFTSYGIDVYDLSGSKVRRIEKQTRRIDCPVEFKEKVEELNPRNPSINFVADYMKQILRIYADKNGNLWVKPAVEGFGLEHNYFDIFSPQGVFLKRIDIPLPVSSIWLTFDKENLIAIDMSNSVVKIFEYEFN